MPATSAWSDDRVSTLSRLWVDGLSAAQIAKTLGGVTRNAVIGKAHRLGLVARATPAAPRCLANGPTPRRPRPATSRRPVRRGPVPQVPQTVEPEAPGLVARMSDLAAHVCRWPLGDPKDAGFSFCGRPAQGRYCATHERLGTRPGTAWRADRDPVVKRALAGLI